MMQKIETVVAVISKAMYFFAALAIVLMMFHISGDVFARTFFGSALPGTLEITAEWYMIAIVYMPLALIQLRGSNITVDLFTQNLPERVQHILDVLTSFAALVFLYYWADASFDLAVKKTKRLSFLDSGLWQIPTWPVYWACFLAIVVLFIATLVVMLRAIRGARTVGEIPKDV